MITLHHLENSQSIRILWLLEEIGAPYDFRMYDRDPKTLLAPADFKSVSPLGTAPAITDGDLALAESNAIIDYVLDRHPEAGLRPAPGDADRAAYLFWFHAAQGSFQSLLTGRYVNGLATERVPGLIRPIVRKVMGVLDGAFYGPRLERILDLMERDLAEGGDGKARPFLAGERFTAADIALGYSLLMADGRGGLLAGRPASKAYLERMTARPAWQRALARDGKFGGVPA